MGKVEGEEEEKDEVVEEEEEEKKKHDEGEAGVRALTLQTVPSHSGGLG